MRKKAFGVCFVLAAIFFILFIMPFARVLAEFSIKWDKTWGGTEWDRVHSEVVNSDGSYAIASYTNSFDSANYDC